MSTDSPAASSTSATAFSNDAQNSASRSAPRRRLNSGTRQPTSSTAAYRERDGTTAPAVPRRAPSVPEPAEVMWHNRAVLTSMTGFGRKAQKWDSLDPNLKSYAHMAVAALVGCTWCLDFGYFHAHDEGLGMNGTRVRAPPQPALHRGLRDARLRLQRRGRRPEDVAAVGRRRPGGGARPARLPGPHRHPPGAEPVADPGATAREVRRRVAAGAAADEPRCGCRRRARGEDLHRDAHRARGPLRRDHRSGRQVAGRRRQIAHLAPDVVAVSDGAGLVAANSRPIQGAKRVAGFLVALPAQPTSR
jgi:hypothetical protein